MTTKLIWNISKYLQHISQNTKWCREMNYYIKLSDGASSIQKVEMGWALFGCSRVFLHTQLLWKWEEESCLPHILWSESQRQGESIFGEHSKVINLNNNRHILHQVLSRCFTQRWWRSSFCLYFNDEENEVWGVCCKLSKNTGTIGSHYRLCGCPSVLPTALYSIGRRPYN